MTPEQIAQKMKEDIQYLRHKVEGLLRSMNFHKHSGSDLTQKIPFIGLLDTPQVYTGAAGKVVTVNSSGTGLQFSTGTSAYGGSVNSDGTAGSPIPAGWTTATGGTGIYTVTHNLGTTAYTVVASCGVGVRMASVAAIATNSFEIRLYDSTTALANAASKFILVLA